MAMQEPSFLILTVLAGPPVHGYGIMRAIEELTNNEIQVRPGTLYTALDRLTVDGLVEMAREEHSPGGQLRRYYQLTPAGAARLQQEAQRRAQLAAVASRRVASLRLPPETEPRHAH